MGNAALCSTVSKGRVAKVISIDGGKVKEYFTSARVAELMLENPGSFICDRSYLRVGMRVPGLAADEVLEACKLYFILPVDMLYSVLTEEEMAWISQKASAAALKRKKKSSKNVGRIFPVCLFPADHDQGKKEELEETASGGDHGVKRLEKVVSRQKSWKPALDTIEEVP